MKTDPSISEQIAKYYVESKTEDIPQEVFVRAKECILDYLGCAIGGADLDSTQMVKKVFIPKDYSGDCTVFNGLSAPADKAAFINGAASHGLEMDDAGYEAGGHLAVAIIPAAMAMAEEQNVSGTDFMLSVIWGYDMMTRVGRAVIPDNHFERGFHPTATCGIFGAAAAASWILKLDAKKIANALGIAGGFSAGNLECYADGSLTKRLNPGHAAYGGVTAAKLAAVGYTGPKWIFEGGAGFLHAYTDGGIPENMLIKMDYKQYPITLSSFKPYACCRYNHAPIDSVLKIKQDHNVTPEDIEKITIDTCSMAIRAVVEPRDIKYNPPNVVGAQFSLPYTVSVATLFDDASVLQFTEEKLRDPKIKEMANRIEMVHTGEMDQYLPTIFAANVTILLKDGREFNQLTKFSKGDPENPITPDELKAKFIALCKINISEEKALKIYDAVMNLDKISMKEFSKTLQ